MLPLDFIIQLVFFLSFLTLTSIRQTYGVQFGEMGACVCLTFLLLLDDLETLLSMALFAFSSDLTAPL